MCVCVCVNKQINIYLTAKALVLIFVALRLPPRRFARLLVVVKPIG